MHKHIIGIFLFILFLSTILSGCSFRDIDKRSFVTAVGIDASGNEKSPYKVTLKLALPMGTIKDVGIQYSFMTEEGNSIADIIHLLKASSDKDLDFSHMKIIVIGKNLLNNDISEITDFFMRRRDIQLISWIAVGEPSAEETLKRELPTEKSSVNPLVNFFTENAVRSPYIVRTYLFDFQRKLKGRGIDPVLPIVYVDQRENKLDVNKSVVINEKKHVELTSLQSSIYNMFIEKNDFFYFTNYVNEKDFYTIFIDKAKVKYKMITEKNPVIKVDVHLEGIIEEANIRLYPKKLEQYSKESGEKIKQQILDTLKFFQRENVDPIGFGLRYRATRLSKEDLWDEWIDLYPNIPFDVNVDLKIISTGSIE